jgi:hypothetical protein
MTHSHEIVRGLRGFAGFSSPMVDAQSEFGTHGHAIHCKYCSGLTKEKIPQNPARVRWRTIVRPNRGISPSHPTSVTCEVTVTLKALQRGAGAIRRSRTSKPGKSTAGLVLGW